MALKKIILIYGSEYIYIIKSRWQHGVPWMTFSLSFSRARARTCAPSIAPGRSRLYIYSFLCFYWFSSVKNSVGKERVENLIFFQSYCLPMEKIQNGLKCLKNWFLKWILNIPSKFISKINANTLLIMLSVNHRSTDNVSSQLFTQIIRHDQDVTESQFVLFGYFILVQTSQTISWWKLNDHQELIWI